MKGIFTFTTRRTIFVSLLTIVGILFIFLMLEQPSNNRHWSPDQALLPTATIDGTTITITNIRNAQYVSQDEYIPHYYNKTVDLNELVSVDYIVEPLASIAVAHTLLSFGFTDGSYIAISAEIRKEVGESFSPLRGLFRQYELMYVVMDERDALQLRAIHRDNPVYIFPTTASPEAARVLFVDMLTRANALAETPEFYNTISNTCTTNIAAHIDAITPGKIGFDIRLLLPLYSDVLAYEHGLIDTSVPLEMLREQHNAKARIESFADHKDFSRLIRTLETTTDSIQSTL